MTKPDMRGYQLLSKGIPIIYLLSWLPLYKVLPEAA